MLRSLYSGVSGMRSFQTKMDVIANNIANVNTTGFKSGRTQFQDMLSQTTATAQGPSGNLGGVNPQQIGLGVRVGAVDTIMTGGPLQPTNRGLDFAIEGDGFFIVEASNGGNMYTRDGSFYVDHEGNLADSNGNHLKGYGVKDGKKNGSSQKVGVLKETGMEYDKSEVGNLKNLKIPQRINGRGEPEANGDYELDDFAIDGSGAIIGLYVKRKENGDTESIRLALGKLGMAKFSNPEGLEKAGNNNYIQSNNSGEVQVGKAGDGGYGVIRQGFLEMSNVDLANEFTEMIVTSRAYQANSRSITTSDEMLQELINLKR